jgi:hypothetical protein
MVMPAPVFPDLIVIHTEFSFGFFKTLLYGPTKTTEPDKRGQSGADRRVTQEITV